MASSMVRRCTRRMIVKLSTMRKALCSWPLMSRRLYRQSAKRCGAVITEGNVDDCNLEASWMRVDHAHNDFGRLSLWYPSAKTRDAVDRHMAVSVGHADFRFTHLFPVSVRVAQDPSRCCISPEDSGWHWTR